jgi:hypothetical protein
MDPNTYGAGLYYEVPNLQRGSLTYDINNLQVSKYSCCGTMGVLFFGIFLYVIFVYLVT